MILGEAFARSTVLVWEKTMKVFTSLVLILLFAACGKDKPNQVLKTTIEVNKTNNSDSDKSKFHEGSNVDDSKEDINLDLNKLKDQVVNAKEINLDSYGDNKEGDELVGPEEYPSDSTTQSSVASDNVITVVDVSSATESELPENGIDITESHIAESTLEGNSSPIQNPEKDYFGESFSMSEIADLSGQYNIFDHIKEEYFRYDDLVCASDFANSEAIAAKVTCVTLDEYTDNYKLFKYSPCIFNDRLYLHGEEWTEFKMVKIPNNANVKFGNQYLYAKYIEVVYECNNGVVTSR